MVNLNLASSENGRWITITGAAVIDYSGTEVSAAGDVNGDGISDVVIGAPGAGDAGTSYVVFGSKSPNDLSLADLYNDVTHTSSGFSIVGANFGDNLGFSVSGAGDFNNDGYDDVALGAPGVGYYDNGASYVVYGSKMPAETSWWTPERIALVTVGGFEFLHWMYNIYTTRTIFQAIEQNAIDYYNILGATAGILQAGVVRIDTGLQNLAGVVGGIGGALQVALLGGGAQADDDDSV